VPSGGYFLHSMDQAIANFSPFIMYGITDIQSPGDINQGYTPSIVEVAVIIVVDDEGIDVNITKRMFRYGRALKEVFEENFDSAVNGAVKLQVLSQVPINLQLLNDSNKQKAVGVLLRASMG
jgi:hypothetical protein